MNLFVVSRRFIMYCWQEFNGVYKHFYGKNSWCSCFFYMLYFPIAWLRAILMGISVYKVFPVPPGTVMSIIRLVREEIDVTFWRYDIFSRTVFGFFQIVLFKGRDLTFYVYLKTVFFFYTFAYSFYLKLICFHRFNWRLLLKQN